MRTKRKQLNVQYSIAAAASFITFLTYLPALYNRFVFWDDNQYVYDNPHIRSLNLSFFKWAFSGFHASNWHPLTWISHAIDYAIWGLNPLGHHLTNNILHAVNTFLVVILVARLLEAWKEEKWQGLYIAVGVTGLLFGIHPVHVESVAWVSERKNLLCALFFLLSIIMYTKYVIDADDAVQKNTKPRLLNKQFSLSLGFFTLALLSKPMAVSLPFVLLILDWYLFKKIQSVKLFLSAVVEKLPFMALGLISSMLTIMAQKSGGTLNMKLMESVPLSARLLVAVKSLIAYLWKMVLPLNLVPYYPYPKDISLFSVEYLLPSFLVVGITTACVIMAKKRKLLLSVWSYYILTLIPVIGIVQVGPQSMADRYAYLPSIGPFLALGLLAAWITGIMTALQGRAVMVKLSCVAAAILLIVSLSFLTIQQIRIWKDGVTLWSYIISKEPEEPFGYLNLGNFYIELNMPDKAIEEYLTAIKLKPDCVEAHNNLGFLYQNLNMPDKAIEEYLTAIKLKPDWAEGHNSLGFLYQNLNMPGKAIGEYLTAIKLKPDLAEAHNNLGLAYQDIDMPDKAIEEYLTAIKLKPDLAEAHNNLGFVYYKIGQREKSREELNAALQIKPNLIQARQLLEAISR